MRSVAGCPVPSTVLKRGCVRKLSRIESVTRRKLCVGALGNSDVAARLRMLEEEHDVDCQFHEFHDYHIHEDP